MYRGRINKNTEWYITFIAVKLIDIKYKIRVKASGTWYGLELYDMYTSHRNGKESSMKK